VCRFRPFSGSGDNVHNILYVCMTMIQYNTIVVSKSLSFNYWTIYQKSKFEGIKVRLLRMCTDRSEQIRPQNISPSYSFYQVTIAETKPYRAIFSDFKSWDLSTVKNTFQYSKERSLYLHTKFSTKLCTVWWVNSKINFVLFCFFLVWGLKFSY
jgi:hypothetical protein